MAVVSGRTYTLFTIKEAVIICLKPKLKQKDMLILAIDLI